LREEAAVVLPVVPPAAVAIGGPLGAADDLGAEDGAPHPLHVGDQVDAEPGLGGDALVGERRRGLGGGRRGGQGEDGGEEEAHGKSRVKGQGSRAKGQRTRRRSSVISSIAYRSPSRPRPE